MGSANDFVIGGVTLSSRLILGTGGATSHTALAGGKFPTGARASFAIEGSWAAIDRSRHKLTDYVTPKSADP